MTYLPEGLPAPNTTDPLMAPYWEATRQHALKIQSCAKCGAWQWGPEWICHRCHSFDLAWKEVAGEGRIYSYQRIWHPVHRALNGHGPYIAVLVELPQAGNVRMVGNLLGDPRQDVWIGAGVRAVFEPRDEASPSFTLVHWQVVP
ncbi:MAG TPA: OB-fold domain-containing protein [Terriglobia bacterium]|nr:OB-fold domain-containing protein [Terriglobia bacterium]